MLHAMVSIPKNWEDFLELLYQEDPEVFMNVITEILYLDDS